MLSSQQFGRLLEPGLRKIFFETYKELPEQYSQVFNVQKSTKAIETDLRMGGFGLWEKKDSMGSVKYQETVDPQALQYVHEEFASGFLIERKLVDDEAYSTINKRPAGLARAARATIETKAAEIFNNAFTVNGFDGKPLISTTHVRLDGGSMSNRLEANATLGSSADGALSDRNLKAGIIQMRKQVDERGLKIQVTPKILLVSSDNEPIARTILGSMNLSAQGNGTGITNDKNILSGQLKVVVLDYLTDPKAWFLIDPTVAELNFFWRIPLEFNNEKDFKTHAQAYQGYCRFSVGYSDYRGILGSAGTGAV